MVMRRSGWTWMGVLALVLVACGGGGAREPQPSGGGPLAKDAIARSLDAATCAFLLRCSPENFETEADCAALGATRTTTFGTNQALQASVDAGKVAFDGAKARRCLDKYASLACDAAALTAFASDADCADAFVGQTAEGGACITSEACAEGLLCLQASALACGATCERKGVRCNTDLDCSAEQLCDSSSKSCRAPSPPPGPRDQPCGERGRCEEGLACVTTSSAQLCRPPLAEGAPCTSARECSAGLTCVVPGGSFTGSCSKRVTDVAEGGRCGLFNSLGSCASGLVCVPTDDLTDGLCLKRKKKGESCTHLFQCGRFFGGTLLCDAQAKTCVDRPSSGPCPSGSYGCNADSFCGSDGSSQICIRYRAEGETCSPSQQDRRCNSATSVCGSGGTCEPRPPATVCPVE